MSASRNKGADDKGSRYRLVSRHSLSVRFTHWVNVVVLAVMLGSGLQIYNAHPASYWGSRSDRDQAILSMRSERLETGELRGVTEAFGRRFDTTGVLGAFKDDHGQWESRGFPSWATIPGERWLAMGRRWHFFFAWLFVLNGLFYAAAAVAGRHLTRDLLPTWPELKDLGGSIRRHLSFRVLRAESEHGYNVLQKLSYLVVVFVLGSLVVLSGLAMSPWLNSVVPLPALFGGRQAARTVHFVIAFSFVAFVIVHVAMVLVVGPLRHLRAMTTGRLRVKERA
ncbi:MAG: cytochrome b/b6 domain-containing protein [bacterium]